MKLVDEAQSYCGCDVPGFCEQQVVSMVSCHGFSPLGIGTIKDDFKSKGRACQKPDIEQLCNGKMMLHDPFNIL